MALTDKLTAIANAIRAKTGKTAKMTMTEMATEITNIPQTSTGAENGVIDRSVTSYSNDSVTEIGMYAFSYCSKLTEAEFPAATSVSYCSFFDCSNLQTVKFSAKVSIAQTAFSDCSKLTALVLKSNELCELQNTTALSGTPIKNGTGYIYVTDSLVDSYKSAVNWRTYAAQIKPLSEYTGG